MITQERKYLHSVYLYRAINFQKMKRANNL